MSNKLLICTDLDRTLIPNGPQAESPGARRLFAELVGQAEVSLAYVSGRDRKLVEKAIGNYSLPLPDYVITDVGTMIYEITADNEWNQFAAWEEMIASDWAGFSHDELKSMLSAVSGLRLQEYSKQNRFKLSYYVPMQADSVQMTRDIERCLRDAGIRARLIWSVDEPNEIGLLDVLPEQASKYHAIRMLIRSHGFDLSNTVFAGDSGNDIEVLTSPIPSVLVANSAPEVRAQARETADRAGNGDALYMARGDFFGMNGNYSAGILEGVHHFQPHALTSLS